MGCPITLLGLSNECDIGIGGITELIVASRELMGSRVTVGTTGANKDKIISITKTNSKNKAIKYIPSKFSSGLETTVNIDHSAGSLYYESSCTLVFTKMDSVKRLEFNQLAKGDLMVIVKDNNGVYWYMGKDSPVNASAGSSGTGVAAGDSNRFEIVLTDLSSEPLYEVAQVAIDLVLDGSGGK